MCTSIVRGSRKEESPQTRSSSIVRLKHAAGVAREDGEDLELDVGEADRLAADLDGALVEVDPQALRLERLLLALAPRAAISARRSTAFTRLRNSRMEKGLVM